MLTFFTPFDVKMIQISTFPAAPSTERVPSLAERVASLRYSINLQLLNNRVPGLIYIQIQRYIHQRHKRQGGYRLILFHKSAEAVDNVDKGEGGAQLLSLGTKSKRD